MIVKKLVVKQMLSVSHMSGVAPGDTQEAAMARLIAARSMKCAPSDLVAVENRAGDFDVEVQP